MIFIWIIVGCIAVGVTYFLPGTSTEFWPNLNAAGSVLALYIAALLGAFARKKDISTKRRNVVLACGVVALGTTWFTWTSWEDQSRWQANTLGEIGSVISHGIYKATLTDSLLNVLEAYYAQKEPRRKPIGQVFREIHPPGIPSDSFSTLDAAYAPSEHRKNPADVFLVSISDTHVTWVARHPWYKGQDPAFKNHADRIGTVQVRLTLTEKGVDYGTEN